MQLDQLRGLKTLLIGDTQIDCKDLAHFPKVLRHLVNLNISHLKNVSYVLQIMQKSTAVNFFDLADTNLSASDLTYIASMSNLKLVDFSGNKIIGDASLAKFSHLGALEALSLQRTKVTSACGKDLAKFPKLSRIIFSSKFKYYESRMRSDLPGCKLVFED
jgi:Leucine-rich repeat (LRR) protein